MPRNATIPYLGGEPHSPCHTRWQGSFDRWSRVPATEPPSPAGRAGKGSISTNCVARPSAQAACSAHDTLSTNEGLSCERRRTVLRPSPLAGEGLAVRGPLRIEPDIERKTDRYARLHRMPFLKTMSRVENVRSLCVIGRRTIAPRRVRTVRMRRPHRLVLSAAQLSQFSHQ